ncbi:MAG: ABC transporter substrate-binding protein [Candidatus Limnocylindria bacterium]
MAGSRARPTVSNLTAVAAVLMLFLASCTAATSSPAASSSATGQASASESAEATPLETVDVRFSTDFLLWGWHSWAFAAGSEAIFEGQGLDVQIEAGQGSVNTAAQLAAGAVDFALLDISTAMVAMTQDADIVLVGVHMQRHPGGFLFIEERNSIETFDDLEGLSIGGASGDAYLVVLPELMEQNGADPAGYTLVTMEPAATTGALIADQVDAIPGSPMTAPPRAAAAAAEGLTLGRFSYADNGYEAVGFAIATNGDTYRDRPEVVQRFVNAWAESVLWSLDNPDEAVDAFIAANPDKQLDPERESWDNASELLAGADGQYFSFDAERMQINIDFVNSQEGSELSADDGFFTNEFVDQLPDGYTDGALGS